MGEAIKCRYEDIFKYIVDNSNEDKKTMNENITNYCLKYHNFAFLPEVIDNFIFYLCFFNYNEMINIFLKQKKKIEITKKIKNSK